MEIMKLDGITPEDIISSLSVERNRNAVFKAGQGAGLSGSFFFFSHDNRFIIKTLNAGELKNLLKMVDPMVEHLKNTDNKSVLARIYCVFTIKTNLFSPLSVMVM
jgi:hypothetical protein